MPVWDQFISETDRAVYALSGYGARGGFGQRPAVIVVDVNYAFTGDRDEPITESVKKWRNSCGHVGWRAIPPTQALLRSARAARVPVFFTTLVDWRADRFDMGGFAYKSVRSGEDLSEPVPGIDGNDIVREIAPEPHEFLIRKHKASPFHGTPLLGYLIELGVDTLIVTGTTTSGCVRATVVDGFQFNFHVSVVEECCFDRFESSHAISLFDMNAKYADVVPLAETTAYLDTLERGLYDAKIAFPRTTV